MTGLNGKIALVTGGSKGIGSAIVQAYVKAGITVAFTYHSDGAAAEAVQSEARAQGGKALAIQADLRDPGAAAEVAAQANDALGRIDILVNNAGITMAKPWQQVSIEDWNMIIATNLTSAFAMTQAVAPQMQARGWGRIIMLSSVAAQLGGVVGPHYAASKAGMLGLVHSYAALMARDGVTANAIAPALIETGMLANNPNIKKELIPVGRFGATEEVAAIALLLAGNGYITGQTMNVNGGWYMS